MKLGRLYCEACKQGISEHAASTGPACPWCGVEAITRAGGEELGPELEEDLDEQLDQDEPLEEGGLDDVEVAELLPCEAPLLRPVGGVQRGRVVYVTGPAGAGKSTCCAEVAVVLDIPPLYLDAEMPVDQCRDVFVRAGADRGFLAQVRRIPGRPGRWQEALERLRELGAELVIVDSLHAWAGRLETEREALMRELCAWAEDTGGIALVIAHWAREGHASGETTAEHLGHMTAIVRPESIEVPKCRWAFCRPGQLFPRGQPPKARKASPAAERDRSPWEVLGVSEGASQAEIKRAFRSRAAVCHPDKAQGLSEASRAAAEAEFKAVNTAWERLKSA